MKKIILCSLLALNAGFVCGSGLPETKQKTPVTRQEKSLKQEARDIGVKVAKELAHTCCCVTAVVVPVAALGVGLIYATAYMVVDIIKNP